VYHTGEAGIGRQLTDWPVLPVLTLSRLSRAAAIQETDEDPNSASIDHERGWVLFAPGPVGAARQPRPVRHSTPDRGRLGHSVRPSQPHFRAPARRWPIRPVHRLRVGGDSRKSHDPGL